MPPIPRRTGSWCQEAPKAKPAAKKAAKKEESSEEEEESSSSEEEEEEEEEEEKKPVPKKEAPSAAAAAAGVTIEGVWRKQIEDCAAGLGPAEVHLSCSLGNYDRLQAHLLAGMAKHMCAVCAAVFFL